MPQALRALAGAALDRYAYPVDTQVLSPTGELLGHLPVSELFSGAPFDYAGTLRRALEPL